MNRNSLLIESLRREPARPQPGVWAMALAIVGAAFGAPSARRRELGR